MDRAIEGSIFQVAEELKWERAAPGVQRQMMGYDENLMLVKVKFEKDAVGSAHEHFHTQGCFIASGVFEVTIGDQKKVLGAGDGFFVPSNTVHGVICLEPGVLIDSFSPYRQDFI
jgi:quercetin dioxygenase-like cupin family protein